MATLELNASAAASLRIEGHRKTIGLSSIIRKRGPSKNGERVSRPSSRSDRVVAQCLFKKGRQAEKNDVGDVKSARTEGPLKKKKCGRSRGSKFTGATKGVK